MRICELQCALFSRSPFSAQLVHRNIPFNVPLSRTFPSSDPHYDDVGHSSHCSRRILLDSAEEIFLQIGREYCTRLKSDRSDCFLVLRT
ncbi:hypothetical protein PMAYCL1PPCAC_26977 [Pristionchus mayeri]|uniref:Uncharacterized protein n=1 Tax=Pristionchus mayeri TaxID=1317129 RepID=A0AAN5D6W0_9BILA|nr:hypothetical protein PMAYCL1PPCAC_26977 [Pristionchus mayeri]